MEPNKSTKHPEKEGRREYLKDNKDQLKRQLKRVVMILKFPIQLKKKVLRRLFLLYLLKSYLKD